MPRAPKAVLLSAVFAASALPAAAHQSEIRADPRPAFERFVRSQGAAYGLSFGPQGETRLLRNDLKTGRPAHQTLAGPVLQRLMSFIAAIPPGRTEERLAQALRLYLDGRETRDAAFAATLFAKGKDGLERLTALGRSLLLDILTAEDGRLFKDEKEGVWERLRRWGPGGGPAAQPPLARRPKTPETLDGTGLDSYFDGAAGAGGLAAFDWARIGPAPLVTRDPGLQHYAIDREKGTVRVLVAANRSVAVDRFDAVSNAAEGRQVLAEAGLDAKLFSAHGAKLVRAVDHYVTVEVPLPQASKLGLALQRQGVMSRPARVFRASAAGIGGGPGWMAPTTQFLPFPSPSFPLPAGGARAGRGVPGGAFQTFNADSGRMLGLEALWKRGMTGGDAVVGVIDSGLNAEHPDLKGRVLEYVDMTAEADQKDAFGHGTHVAGSIGGSGAASDGRFKGAAPDTKFVVFKVFDKNGNTTEDTILAALKRAAALPPEKRPQVINMSLGGPGDPDLDPLSRLANRLMLKDNILVVAAAGNSGPMNDTVGAPGNAQYVLTVTGVNKQGEFPFFSSRGPIGRKDGKPYGKPDLSTVAGDVNLKGIQSLESIRLLSGASLSPSPTAGEGGGEGNKIQTCVFGPGGVISDRSSDDPDTACIVPGHPNYRYMSGTSMAAPLAAGAAADVIGYLRQKGVAYRATDIKAVLMETAGDLKKPSEMQGAGLLSGDRLAAAVIARVQAGVPVGNIAYMLSVRLTSDQRQALAASTRFRATPLGIVDTKNGRLIKTDAELFWLMQEIQGPVSVAYSKPTSPLLGEGSESPLPLGEG